MNRYASLIERARVGQPILIDGATGSECFRRGVPRHEHGWSGGAALSHPDIVRSIHADYIEIGADLVVSNTFAAGRNVLRDVGNDSDFEALNRRAIELVREARDNAGTSAANTVVGGGISNWSFSSNHPSLDQLHADTLAQATIMREAGAEVLSLEMMVDLPRFGATLDAASSVGLPVWVGLTVGDGDSGEAEELGEVIELREGGLLSDAVQMAADNEVVDALCIMHTDVRLVERCLSEVRRQWTKPLGAYAHASGFVDGEFTHDGIIAPDEYAAYLPAWRAAGATMLGGCCGIGPDHIRLIAAELA